MLVGDPKQAIYAFRGADVHAYLAARRQAGADRVEALTTNWRSDAGLLRGLDAVFGSATLGHADIAYRVMAAADHHREPRLRGGRRTAPVRLRHVRRDVADAVLTPTTGDLQVDWARAFVARDLAADVVFQLDAASRATIVERDADGTEQERPVQPGDIAVLVQRHKDADLVRDALARVGVPTVVNGTGSVFDTAAAQDWLALLEAIESPAATTRVRSAAMSSFFGWRAEDVAVRDDEAWDAVHADLHEWRRVLVDHGVAALFDRVQAGRALPARLLGVLGGERTLTDLRHLTELLHEQGAASDSSPATLLTWLRERIRRAEREADAENRSRRLETDARAVQVWTVHRSKGLEFPIVYAPFLWRAGWIPPDAPPLFHDDDGERCIDVGGPRPDAADHVARHVAEQRGEELRLAYVALTRARHQVVLWWASTHGAHESPLGTLLFAPHAAGGELANTPDDDRARTVLDVVALEAPGELVIERAHGATDARWHPGSSTGTQLDVRRFGRSIDRSWRRTSYSAMTAAAYEEHAATHVPGAAPEHDDRGAEDERLPVEAVVFGDAMAADEERLRAEPSRFGDTGGGARFGTLVHAVLEDVDFAAPDLPGALRSSLEQRRRGHDDLDADRLVDGLAGAIETPLGPLVRDLRLRDVPTTDRLDELHFELPLAGGDEPTGHR